MKIPTSATLRRALADYESVVELQGVAKLVELDRWYRCELPALIEGRAPAHLTRAELVRATEWKMARGVWRQGNLVLVRGNDAATVAAVSREALALIPHPTAPIAALAKQLDGVGPATASAIAAAVAPDVYPFFDEIVAAQLSGLGEVKWTLAYYAKYAQALRELATTLAGEWTPVTLERALWSCAGGKAGGRAPQ